MSKYLLTYLEVIYVKKYFKLKCHRLHAKWSSKIKSQHNGVKVWKLILITIYYFMTYSIYSKHLIKFNNLKIS